jgi:6-phosphogluconolactonase
MRRWSIPVAVLLIACGGDDDGAVATPSSSASTAAGGNGGTGADGGGGTGGLGGGGAQEYVRYLYVSNGDSDSVSGFSIDEATGALTSLGETNVTGGPGAIAVEPNPLTPRIYVARRNDQSVAAFQVTPTGALTLLGSTPVGLNPVYLSVPPNSNYLLMADYGADRVRAFGLNEDGSVGGLVADEATDTNPHCILTDASGEVAFVPNTNADAIFVYAFGSSDGTLTAAPPIPTPPGEGPRHMVFHPTLGRFYVVNEHADSVSTYDHSPGSMTASLSGTLSTLPPNGPGDQNTCADIHVTPDGRFVYASNRGHDSIAMFAADASGALTFLGTEPTEATPREFEVAVEGQYLYAAGQSSGMLAAYAIDPTAGTLAPIATYPVGQGPLWVTEVKIPR